MFTKHRLPYTIAIGLLILALLFTISTCRKNQNKNVNLQGELSYQTQSFDSLKNKKNQIVYEQKVVEVVDDAQLQEISRLKFQLKDKDAKHLKEIKSLASVKQEVRIEKVYIPYTPDIDGVLVKEKLDSIAVPQSFQSSDSTFSITGTIQKDGVSIDTLTVPNEVTFQIAEQKKGLFKSRETTVQVINSNPKVQVTGMQSITVKEKKNTLSKIILIGIGIIGGFLLAK